MLLPNEALASAVDTASAGSANQFEQALGLLVPPGHEVPPSQVMPEGVMRDHTKVGGMLSDETMHTLSDSLASELEYIIELKKENLKRKSEGKNEIKLDPWMATLYNQAVKSSEKTEGQPLDYENLFSVADENLRSADPTISRLWEEIGDRVIKQQLARIEVLTEGELELTSPTDVPEYTPRETLVPSVGAHGEIKPPEYNGPEGGGLKRWWNSHRNDVTNSDRGDGRRWWFGLRKRFAKHQFYNGLTPKFAENAVIDYSRTLDGDTEHKAAEWMRLQPELRRGTGSPVGDFDKERLGERMVHMAAAISEVSDRRHDEALTEQNDFIFSRPKVDDNSKPIPGEFETTGRGRHKVQLHIEGVRDPFPVDFVTMKPDEQLNILTNVLDQRALKELRQINKKEHLAGPLAQHIAEAEGALATSADPKRFDTEIKDHETHLGSLRKQETALGTYLDAEADVEAKTKALEGLTAQKTRYEAVLTTLQDDHDTFRDKTKTKADNEQDILTITQLTDLLKTLEAKKNGKKPPVDIDAQIATVEKKLAGRGPQEIGDLKKANFNIDGEIERVQDQEAQYQEVRRLLKENSALITQATIQKGDSNADLVRQATELYKLYGLDKIPKDATEEAKTKIVQDREDLLKSAEKRKTAVADEIARRLLSKSELRARAEKQDAGIAWRLNKLQSCKELLLGENRYQAIEWRIEQGTVDVSFDPTRASENPNHTGASYIKAAHVAMPNLPPAYLHAIYVFAGREALEQTTEGQKLFKKATQLLTPVDFYQVLLRKPARIRKLLTVLGAHPPESIYDERFTKDPRVMDEVMGMMDSAFLEELVDFTLYSARDGYDSEPDREFAKRIGQAQGVLESGSMEQTLNQEKRISEVVQVESAIEVVQQIHTTNIEVAGIADTYKIEHDIALRAAGHLKFAMDRMNVMKLADIPASLGGLAASIDALIPATDRDGGAIDKNLLAQAIAEKLINHPANGTDFVRQADCVGMMPDGYRKVTLIEALLLNCKSKSDGSVELSGNYSPALKAELEEGLTNLMKNGYALDSSVNTARLQSLEQHFQLQEQAGKPVSEEMRRAGYTQIGGEVYKRGLISQELVESLTRIMPPTPDAEKELLVLSSVLPTVDAAILQALSQALALAVSQRKQIDKFTLFDIPNGDIIQHKFDQKMTEIMAMHNDITGAGILDISTLENSEVITLLANVNSTQGLRDENLRYLLNELVRDGQRVDMVRFYDQTLGHLEGAQLALEIQADTQFDLGEALVIAHMIREKRKLRTNGQAREDAVESQSAQMGRAPAAAEAHEDVEDDEGNE